MRRRRYREKSGSVFTYLLPVLLICACVCAVYLGNNTYAWFSDDVRGSNNVIGASDTVEMSVSVYKQGEAEAIVTLDSDGAETLTMEGAYTVKLLLPKQSASGYLVMSIGGVDYRSDYLKRSETDDQELSFTLELNAPTEVKLAVRWGTYFEEPHVQNGGTLRIG